jgi:hypothetical protein
MNLQLAAKRKANPVSDKDLADATSMVDTNTKWLGEVKQKYNETFADPPADVQKLYQLFDQLTKAQLGTKDYMSIAQQICDLSAKNLFLIGTVHQIPKPWIVKNNLRNVPGPDFFNEAYLIYDTTGYGYQFYFKQ